tara:strand:+ start:7852 stop:8352 length:501 start_codon:yes stop_codon:yes gene_type:complete
MVRLDHYKWRKFFIKKAIELILRLFVFILLYFGLVRPIQEIILGDIVVPRLRHWNNVENDIFIDHSQDDLQVESRGNQFIDTRVSLPFSAYYFLAITFFFSNQKSRLLGFIHLYNLGLFIVLPILCYHLINGFFWLAPLINAHEMAYKALFLSIGMLGLKKYFSEK